MALVGTRMDGDALGTEPFAVDSELLYIGGIAASRIADSGHFVDIDAEFCHGNIID